MKGLFLFLLSSTLFCLLFPIKYEKKMTIKKLDTVEKYKKATTASINYRKKYKDYLLEKETITNKTKSDLHRIPEVDGVVGILYFPTVCLTETPIYKGETKEAFFHYKCGSFPTTKESGLTVVAVNDHWKNLVDLVRLTQLKVGDCFYLRLGDQTSTYQITTILIGDQQEEREIIPNEQILTIERKNLAGFTDEQVLIESKRIAKKPVQDTSITPKINFSYQAIVILFLLLNSLFFGGLVVSYQSYVRKAHATPFRTKNSGYRKLRRLLQITRGYYILLGLIMSFYLAVLIYRFFY